jgi:nitrite transporter NirC
MYSRTIDHFVMAAETKCALLRDNPRGFLAGSMAGGAYVGLGIVLIFSVGANLPGPLQRLGMGLTFAIALILVVIAGAELFTGYAMYLALARLAGRVSVRQALGVLVACWVGNFLGSALVASLFAIGGANGLLNEAGSLVMKAAHAKMAASPSELMARAVLCNWLVCLALWMSARVDSDVAKCVVIFWCLLAFIASGFEHCVANMTLLTLAIIGQHGDAALVAGAAYNLAVVTAGNVIGGGVLVAGTYWLVTGPPSMAAEAPRSDLRSFGNSDARGH